MPGREHVAHVRPATRADVPAIVSVVTTSVSEEELRDHGGLDYGSPFREVARLSAVWCEPNSVGTEQIFVAEMDGAVVGVVAVEDRGSELELVDIDVAREHRGRGVGTGLVEYVEAHARSIAKGAVTLGTSRNREGVPWRSLPWWLARGYRITHEEENRWTRALGPGFREIRMRKDLPPER